MEIKEIRKIFAAVIKETFKWADNCIDCADNYFNPAIELEERIPGLYKNWIQKHDSEELRVVYDLVCSYADSLVEGKYWPEQSLELLANIKTLLINISDIFEQGEPIPDQMLVKASALIKY
jgi:hypothetical protein